MRKIVSLFSSLILALAVCSASADEAWKVERLSQPEGLYPGEELLATNGIETLTYFKAGDPEKPLVIFVPGGFHLARVAYGYPGGDERDFLAYWLGEKGYSFLGASYPTGNKVYSKAYPAYSIRDWGKQVAATAKFYIDENKLSREVIVLGWSAGGQIAQSVYEASQKADLEMSLFVSLAATPPAPLLIEEPGSISKAPNGLSSAPQFYEAFKAYIAAQDELNGHVIMPWEKFKTDILGDIPIALNGIITASRYENGKFVKDLDWAMADTGALKRANFPYIVTISGDKVLDNDHALTDRGNWGMFQIQHLYRGIIFPALSKSEKIAQPDWQHIMDLMTYATSGVLSARVPGNHFFWYGQIGARETVQNIDRLRLRAANLKATLAAAVAKIGTE